MLALYRGCYGLLPVRRASQTPLMPPLNTPQEVIQAAGLVGVPQYFNVHPLIDAAGFVTQRLYPPDSPAAQVVTPQGQQVNRCLLVLVVEPPKNPNGISRVGGEARFHESCRDRQLF